MLKKNENGRSMVETLGVIAIVGVLTVGALFGYKYGVMLYKANELIKEVKQGAMLASYQHTQKIALNMSEINKTSFWQLDAHDGCEHHDSCFDISVYSVEKDVCDLVLEKNWNLPIAIAVSEIEGGECAEGENAMAFFFDYGLGEEKSHFDEDGKCVAGFTGENCDTKIECSENGQWTINGCACAEGWYGPTCDTDCDGFKDYNGTCHSCSESNRYDASEEECRRCSGRAYSYGTCMSCNDSEMRWQDGNVCNQCPNKIFDDWYWECVDKAECADDKIAGVKWGSSYCYTCDAEEDFFASEEDCAKCTNRQYKYGKCETICTEDKPVKDTDYGGCYSCDYEYGIYSSDDSCSQCPNRVHLWGYYCATCDDYEVQYADESDCAKCPGKVMDDYSHRCIDECGGSTPLRGSGACHACDTTDNLVTTKERCDICPNRTYEGGRCFIDCRTDAKPVIGDNGNCYSCDEPTAFATTEESCTQCPGRSYVNGKCAKSCEGDAPVMDSNMNCRTCDDSRLFDTSKSECDKCPGREYKDGHCFVKCDKNNTTFDQSLSQSVCQKITGYDQYCQYIQKPSPAGTPCVSSGVEGTCSGKGQCMPNGQSCSSQGSCPAGYYCQYGGSYGGSGQGSTPNKCLKVQPESKTVDGTTYYYLSNSDMSSLCRSGYTGDNCAYGYISYYAAQDWCRSLGKTMVSCPEMVKIRDQIPWSGKYWGAGGECRDDGSVWSGRPDGYANTGNVLCK